MRLLGSSTTLFAATLFLAAGCAAPPVKSPVEAESPVEVSVETPPPVEEVLSATQYLERGKAGIEAARKMRSSGSGGTALSWVAGSEEYGDLYAGAEADFQAIITRYPDSAEAPEASYLLGVINDYPHLERFEDALENYRLTVEKYPGTEAAAKAAERRKAIEEY